MLAPPAVLFIAGALSSLPKIAAWPLHHGYGGLLGDLGLGLLTSLLGARQPRSLGCRGRALLLCGGTDGADVEPRPHPARPQADLPGQRAAKAPKTQRHGGCRRSGARVAAPGLAAAPAGAGRTRPGLGRASRRRFMTASHRRRRCLPRAAPDHDAGMPESGRGAAFDQVDRSRDQRHRRALQAGEIPRGRVRCGTPRTRAARCPRIPRTCGGAAGRHAHAAAATWGSSLSASPAQHAEAAATRQSRRRAHAG